jgi:hypothetical protein
MEGIRWGYGGGKGVLRRTCAIPRICPKCAICGTPPLLVAAVKGKSLPQQALFFRPQ